jgi:hypothetical protein
LAQVAVDAVFFYRDMEHLAGGCAVDVFSFCKYFGTPGLTGEVCKDSGFDRTVIRHDEFIAGELSKGELLRLLAVPLWDAYT